MKKKILCVGGKYHDKVCIVNHRDINHQFFCCKTADLCVIPKEPGQKEQKVGTVTTESIYNLHNYIHFRTGEIKYFYVESDCFYASIPSGLSWVEQFIMDHWYDDLDEKEIAITLTA